MDPNSLKVTFGAEEATTLTPLLESHRQKTGVTGLLAAITRSYRSETDGVTLELQVVHLNRRLAAAINKATRNLGKDRPHRFPGGGQTKLCHIDP